MDSRDAMWEFFYKKSCLDCRACETDIGTGDIWCIQIGKLIGNAYFEEEDKEGDDTVCGDYLPWNRGA